MVEIALASAVVVLLVWIVSLKARIQRIRHEVVFLRRYNSLMIDQTKFDKALSDLTVAVTKAIGDGPTTPDSLTQPFLDGVAAQTARLNPAAPAV